LNPEIPSPQGSIISYRDVHRPALSYVPKVEVVQTRYMFANQSRFQNDPAGNWGTGHWLVYESISRCPISRCQRGGRRRRLSGRTTNDPAFAAALPGISHVAD
jgi:hypothetical protein